MSVWSSAVTDLLNSPPVRDELIRQHVISGQLQHVKLAPISSRSGLDTGRAGVQGAGQGGGRAGSVVGAQGSNIGCSLREPTPW